MQIRSLVVFGCLGCGRRIEFNCCRVDLGSNAGATIQRAGCFGNCCSMETLVSWLIN